MGFFDSMKGAGRALLGGIGDVFEQVAPALAQIGVQRLAQEILPTARGGGTVFAPSPVGLPPIRPTGIIPGPTGFGMQPIAAVPRPTTLGGGPTMGAAPGFQQAGVIPGFLGGLGGGLIPQIPGLFGAPDPSSFFRTGVPMARPISELSQVNPVTGRTHVWKHMGRPVLFSGDLATCKRVRKIAARARTSSRKR